MTYITIPQLSICLDFFGLVILLIILFGSINEKAKEKSSSASFVSLLIFTILTLLADIVAWNAEGKPSLRTVNMVFSTIAPCFSLVAVMSFLNYMRKTLFPANRIIAIICQFLSALGFLSIIALLINVFGGFITIVDESGHLVHYDEPYLVITYLTFPLLAFVTILILQFFATGTPFLKRVAYTVYSIFPLIGAILDFFFLGLSLTFLGFVVSIMLLYTGIYRQKQQLIVSQQNALMLSQINPHFMYNTLSTIAAMCDIEPRQAKKLTLEFSQYLRSNITSLSSMDLIPFSQEMNHVECYLKIEKTRFQESLNVSYSIECKDFYVPPLTIQPLVENAVRHGITRKAGGGTIYISTYKSKDNYVIDIRDNGVGFDTGRKPQDKRKHVGLENITNRIRHMCNGRLEIHSTIGVGTRVIITIPQKHAHPTKEETHEHLSR